VFSTEWQAGIPKFSVSNLHFKGGWLEAVLVGVETEILLVVSEFEELEVVLIGVVSGVMRLLMVRTGKVSVGSYGRENAPETSLEISRQKVARNRERRAQGQKEMSGGRLGRCRDKREDRQGRRAFAEVKL
jgi:hypothetical protein